MRELLVELRDALLRSGDMQAVVRVEDALSSDDEVLLEFLRSNNLWGGAGSIADQGDLNGERSPERIAIESALIALGEAQLSAGITNPRTAMWTDVFKQWRVTGI